MIGVRPTECLTYGAVGRPPGKRSSTPSHSRRFDRPRCTIAAHWPRAWRLDEHHALRTTGKTSEPPGQGRCASPPYPPPDSPGIDARDLRFRPTVRAWDDESLRFPFYRCWWFGPRSEGLAFVRRIPLTSLSPRNAWIRTPYLSAASVTPALLRVIGWARLAEPPLPQFLAVPFPPRLRPPACNACAARRLHRRSPGG
jgi:hypothetical protein